MMNGNNNENVYSEEALELINHIMAAGLPALEHFLKKKLKAAWALYSPAGLLLCSSDKYKENAARYICGISETGYSYFEEDRLLIFPVINVECGIELYLAAEQVSPGKVEFAAGVFETVVPALITYFDSGNSFRLHEPKYYDHIVTFDEFAGIIDSMPLTQGLYCVSVIHADIQPEDVLWRSGYLQIWRVGQKNHHRLYPIGFSGWFIGVLYAGVDEEHPSLEYCVHNSNALQYLSSQFGLPCSGGMGRRYPKDMLVKSYREAVYALSLGYAFGKQEFFYRKSELGFLGQLLALDRAELSRCSGSVMDPLEAYDREKEKSGEPVKTLTTLVNTDFNIKETTAQLGINKTTLYYRLDRIEKVLGGSVTSEPGRTNALLAVKAREILERTSEFES